MSRDLPITAWVDAAARSLAELVCSFDFVEDHTRFTPILAIKHRGCEWAWRVEDRTLGDGIDAAIEHLKVAHGG